MAIRIQFSLGKLTGFVCLCAVCFGLMRMLRFASVVAVPWFLLLWVGIALRPGIPKVGILGFLLGTGMEMLLEFPISIFVIENVAWLPRIPPIILLHGIVTCVGCSAACLFVIVYLAIQKTPIIYLHLTLKSLNVACVCLAVFLLAAAIAHQWLRS